MKKICIQAARIICFILLSVCLIGCKQNQSDYEEYLGRVWVQSDWEEGDFSQTSFIITDVKKDNIEGFLVTGNCAVPSSYSFAYKDDVAKMTGTIDGDTAQCRFKDENGNKGTIQLFFGENDIIEAEIEYEHIEELYNKSDFNGRCVFRLYNLTDYEEFLDSSKEVKKEAELEFWGKVWLTAEIFDTGTKTYPVVYLTDEKGNILYYLDSYYTDSQVENITIEDINEDGRKDIKILINIGNGFEMEKLYFQMENGWFLYN